jgi:hypothetical protein
LTPPNQALHRTLDSAGELWRSVALGGFHPRRAESRIMKEGRTGEAQ